MWIITYLWYNIRVTSDFTTLACLKFCYSVNDQSIIGPLPLRVKETITNNSQYLKSQLFNVTLPDDTIRSSDDIKT